MIEPADAIRVDMRQVGVIELGMMGDANQAFVLQINARAWPHRCAAE